MALSWEELLRLAFALAVGVLAYLWARRAARPRCPKCGSRELNVLGWGDVVTAVVQCRTCGWDSFNGKTVEADYDRVDEAGATAQRLITSRNKGD